VIAHKGWLKAVTPMFRTASGTVALAAALVGIAMTGAGAGIGLRFAQKTGPGVTSAAGFLALAVGLALLGYVGITGWRALHRWTRLWLLPTAVAILVVGLCVTEAVMFTVVPSPALAAVSPANYGMRYTDVSMSTDDGARLSGWYVPGVNGAALVLLHGAGSTRTDTLPQAAVLARHGNGLLLVDARGHGRSGGRGMDLGWYGDRDVTAAVSFLTRQPGVEPGRIGVLGLSMGGEEAIGAAAADVRIRAVVAEGATARTAADKSRWLPHGLDGILQRGIDRLTYALTDLLTPAAPPRTLHDAVAATQIPFLLITAGTRPDEANAAADLYAAAPDRVRTWNVPAAGHTRALAADPAGWESAGAGRGGQGKRRAPGHAGGAVRRGERQQVVPGPGDHERVEPVLAGAPRLRLP